MANIEDIRLNDVIPEQLHHLSAGQYSMIPNSTCGQGGPLVLNQPYRLVEGRLIIVLQGCIRATSNLLEYTLHTGDTLLLPPSCIIELLEMSSDSRVQILSYSDDTFPVKNHEVICITPTSDERAEIDTLVNLVWRNLNRQPAPVSVITPLFQALQSFIIAIHEHNQSKHISTDESRQQVLFHSFLQLVGEHCTHERSLAYYASQLCITPHYLSTMVKQVSGTNGTTWITRAVCLEAKIRLRHSDQLVSQISDDLNFPNPTFFNKYFKREVGMTPGEYRSKE